MRLVALAASLLACGIACGQELLRYAFTPGLAYRFDQSMHMHLDMQIEASGQQFTMQQTMKQRVKGRVAVLEVAEGLPTKIRVALDQDAGMEMTGMGQDRFVPEPLAGRTVIVTVVPDGEPRIEVGDEAGPLPMVDPQTRATLVDLVTPNPAFLPNRVVEVGDEWTATLGKPTDALRTVVTLTVDGFPEREGRRVARLAASSALAQPLDGLKLTGTLTGTVVVDVASGQEVDVTMTGPVQTRGVIERDGMQINISSSGSMTQTFRATFVDAEADAAQERPAGALLPGWQRYTDAASGYSFQHPRGWTVQSNQAGLVLIPSDHDPQREMLVGFGMPAQGITDAAAPVVQQNLDMLVMQQAPMLRRVAQPQPLAVPGGSGASYRYSGTLPDGQQVASTVLVRAKDDAILAIGVFGAQERVAARTPVISTLFGTIASPGELAAVAPGGSQPSAVGDPRLVGMFRGETISRGEGIYINTQLVYALGADGVVHYGAQSHLNASQRDIDGNLIYTANGQSDGSMQRGRWQAQGGMLTIQWDAGGRSVFAYGIEPDGALVLRNPQTRKLINFFPRVR